MWYSNSFCLAYHHSWPLCMTFRTSINPLVNMSNSWGWPIPMSVRWKKSTSRIWNPDGWWVGITYPSSPHRMFDAEAHETLQVWSRLLVFTPFSLSMSPAVHIEVTATADAMASQTLAGLGGGSLFSQWKGGQVSLSDHTGSSRCYMELCGWWYAETHCGLGTLGTVCPYLLHCLVPPKMSRTSVMPSRYRQ